MIQIRLYCQDLQSLYNNSAQPERTNLKISAALRFQALLLLHQCENRVQDKIYGYPDIAQIILSHY